MRKIYAVTVAPWVHKELQAARQARAKGQVKQEFSRLERAHVLGQAATYWHVKVHWLMLLWAIRNKAPRELFGQLLRMIAAVLLTAFGWVPTGNTGGANVNPLTPLPIAADLAAIMQKLRATSASGR